MVEALLTSQDTTPAAGFEIEAAIANSMPTASRRPKPVLRTGLPELKRSHANDVREDVSKLPDIDRLN